MGFGMKIEVCGERAWKQQHILLNVASHRHLAKHCCEAKLEINP